MNLYKNIPLLLTRQPNWVVWGVASHHECRHSQELLKAPFQPEKLLKLRTIPAKSGIPGTWGSYTAAVRCVSRGLARGIGYEFDGRDIYGVDLDHVINDNGTVKPEARAIVEGLASYTEVSPSGHGLHILVTASHADISRHRKQGGFVEIYSNARYFTMTGNVFQGLDRIVERPAELQQLHDRYLLPEPSEANVVLASVNSLQSADEQLTRGLARDPVLRACWNGERRQGDESASDQALMNKLAYWCDANFTAMLAAFLQSPYFAQKDEAHQRKCRRADYLSNTAKAACSSLRSTARKDSERYRQERSKGEAR
jgi:putative DNA primase/helicase